MPLVDDELLTADQAIAKNLCPECAADLTKENPIAHLNTHWRATPPLNKAGDEARRRQALLQDFIAAHGVRTTNMPKPATAKPAPMP